MKKLRNILNCNKFYFILIIFICVYIFLFLFIIKKESVYELDDSYFECVIDNYFIEGDLLKFDLICDEKLVGYYSFSSLEEKESFNKKYKFGDLIIVYGSLEKFSSASNFNMFDYKLFQYNNDIFYKINIDCFYMIGYSKSIVYKVRNFIIDKIENLKSFSYINAMILGNADYINSDVYSSFKDNGILHLFSVSGMHVGVVLFIINKFMKKESIFKNLLIFSILFFYYFLIKNISLLRVIVFYYVNFFNKLFKLKLNYIKCILLSFFILLLLNPYNVYSIGFWYSIIISSALVIFGKNLNGNNYFINIFKVSFVAFIFSFPITISNSYEVNLFSFICNLIFVPFVSFLVYPLCLLTFLFPFLDSILSAVIFLFENLSLFLNSFSIFLTFRKVNVLIIVLYYILLFCCFYNKKFIFILLTFLLIHFNYNFLFSSNFLLFFDVGQGDSSFFYISGESVLIDTGGIIKYDVDEWKKRGEYSIVENITVPVLKSFGIRKISFLVISHGDYDHMGEAINLVNNFKVEKVIFNCGPYNELESELIKVLDKKEIPYYSCIKELNIDNNKLYFLQTKEYDNENDNSNVIYTELNGYKFMFMGDASTTTEQEILKRYNLSDIDVLKVGHHGSKTSSSIEFINEINPKYSIITVGKNNRYGHPNKEALSNLKNSKIYRTDIDGSIMFKIKNNRLKVETCSP